MPLDELNSAPGIEASEPTAEARSSWHHRMVGLLADGIAAAEGAQVLAELYFERDDRDPSNNPNYCRLLDWLKEARRHQAKQSNGEVSDAGPVVSK